jgi:transcription elongation factor Elf1
MTRRHSHENRYCNGCRITTRHEVKETTFSCLRCGQVKYPTRLVVAVAETPLIAVGRAG